MLKVGGPDSDMFLGWFRSGTNDESPVEAGNFLGVHIGGPTRVGHYFQPAFTTASGTNGRADAGPVLSQGKVQSWSLTYDPSAEGGRGKIQVALDQETVTLPLPKGIKVQGAKFDRFGAFTMTAGGQLVRIYFDDLQYTAAR